MAGSEARSSPVHSAPALQLSVMARPRHWCYEAAAIRAGLQCPVRARPPPDQLGHIGRQALRHRKAMEATDGVGNGRQELVKVSYFYSFVF